MVLSYIKRRPEGQVNLSGDNFYRAECERRKLPYDDDDVRVLEVFHELSLERIIIPGGKSSLRWPFYRLTEYGQKVLESGEWHPYDPEGYLANLKRAVPDIDPVIVTYVSEAVACFRMSCLLAAAVMLGGAAEKAILLLVDAYGASLKDEAQKRRFEKETAQWMIGRKYAALWKQLVPLQNQLPDELGRDLHTILDRVFDLIRTTRNEAGHPATGSVEREAVLANFYLFPSYCRRVYGLIHHFT